MSDDGADLGVLPQRALKTVLGGEDQPSEEERLDTAALAYKIREAPVKAESYDGAALACARLILEALETHPALQDVPFDAEYLKGQDGQLVFAPDGGLVKTRPGLYEVLLRLHPENGDAAAILRGLSGFMWGWSCNAVRAVLGQPAGRNPAIVEIGA